MGIVDTNYDTFWKDIIEKDHVIDFEQVKKELYDYSMMMDEVSKAYDMVTGGRISKPNTAAHHVNMYANDNWQAAYDEGYADAKEEYGETSSEVKLYHFEGNVNNLAEAKKYKNDISRS